MQNWEYTFPPTSKEEWIRQIEKDLKGKPIESLYGEWWPGEPLIPIHHASDAADEPIVLPDELFASPPRIVESFDINHQSAEQINKAFLEALKYGTQTFIINCQQTNDFDVNQILEGVFPEMIQWHICVNDHATELYRILTKRSPQTTFLRFKQSDSKLDIQSILKDLSHNSGGFANIRFEYHFKSTGNWVEECSKTFLHLLEDLHQWESIGTAASFFEKCILKLDADVQYFKHIIQTRVLHLLWLNLTHENSSLLSGNKDYLECHVTPKSDETPEHYLIRASMSSLAAALTGITSLCIHHVQKEGIPDFYRRIDRNIHHLLHLESGMPAGKDPLAGAYTLDYYTRLWTERIWNQVFEG